MIHKYRGEKHGFRLGDVVELNSEYPYKRQQGRRGYVIGFGRVGPHVYVRLDGNNLGYGVGVRFLTLVARNGA